MKQDDRVVNLGIVLKEIKRRKLATQADLSAYSGVSQSVISRILSGAKCKMKSDFDDLEKYANMLIRQDDAACDVSDIVQDAAARFLKIGSENELIASIEFARQLRAGGLA